MQIARVLHTAVSTRVARSRLLRVTLLAPSVPVCCVLLAWPNVAHIPAGTNVTVGWCLPKTTALPLSTSKTARRETQAPMQLHFFTHCVRSIVATFPDDGVMYMVKYGATFIIYLWCTISLRRYLPLLLCSQRFHSSCRALNTSYIMVCCQQTNKKKTSSERE